MRRPFRLQNDIRPDRIGGKGLAEGRVFRARGSKDDIGGHDGGQSPFHSPGLHEGSGQAVQAKIEVVVAQGRCIVAHPAMRRSSRASVMKAV